MNQEDLQSSVAEQFTSPDNEHVHPRSSINENLFESLTDFVDVASHIRNNFGSSSDLNEFSSCENDNVSNLFNYSLDDDDGGVHDQHTPESEAHSFINEIMIQNEDENGFEPESEGFQQKALKLNLRDFLAMFILTYGVVRSGGDLLLKYLKLHWPAARELPVTVRGLLKTPRHSTPRFVADDGHYIHWGLVKSLEGKANADFKKIYERSKGHVELIIHWDGAEAVHDQKNTIWPIQAMIRGHGMRPSLVGMYYGKSKPKNFDDFLLDIAKDLKEMRDANTGEDVLKLNGFRFIVDRVIYLADSPATCAAFGLFAPNSFCGCTRCKIKAVSSE